MKWEWNDRARRLAGLSGLAGALLFFVGGMLFYGHLGAGANFAEGMIATVVHASPERLFAGGLVGPLAACLCIVGFYFRDLPRGMAAQMVRVWGVYFLLIASAYWAYNFFPHLPPSAPRLHLEIPEMAGMWLPLGLGFAIANKSESDPSSNVVR